MNKRLAGIVLGTAVGDALGLPLEGLSRRRAHRWTRGETRHRFLFGYGMISDDTEHTLFVAQSLLEHPRDADKFQRRLAWHLRWWFAALPAGIGKATAVACMKLWLGWTPNRSGIFSAGNGPAMRSAIIGGFYCDELEKLDEFVRVSTRLTHTDPKAEVGALAIARIAAWAVQLNADHAPDPHEIVANLSSLARDDTAWIEPVAKILPAIAQQATVADFADTLGLSLGVTGYIYHTVPVAVYAWLRHFGDFEATIKSVLDCGGDTDTVAAIAGALAGATVGVDRIPESWINGILDWPRSISLLHKVAAKLGEQQPTDQPLGEVRYFWPAVLPRNLIFLIVVLLHATRRLFPL